MNRKKLIIITIVLLFAGVTVWRAMTPNNQSQDTTENLSLDDQAEQPVTSTLVMHEEYPALPEDNKFISESGDKIVERFESGTGIILLGFKECPWCQKAVPLLNDAARKENVNVHYLNIRTEQTNNTDTFEKILDILKPHLPTSQDGQVTISTPDISFVKDGEIIWRYKVEDVPESERAPDAYWTDERKQRALKDFRKQMQIIKEE